MCRLVRWMASVVAIFLFWSPSAEAGFAPPEMRSPVVVITASMPNTVVRDCADAECSNGPMAKAIADALKTPDVTIAGFFSRVNASVAAATNRSQLPSITSSGPIDIALHGAGGKSVALVIGNGAYTHLRHLAGAPRDAETVGEGFKSIGFNTKALIDMPLVDVDKEITKLVRDFGAEDTIVLYYAGHGFSLNGARYLPALETEFSRDQNATIGSSMLVSELIERLERSKAGKKILILDTHFPEPKSSIAR
jgi:uncharacterized caspase-like protein